MTVWSAFLLARGFASFDHVLMLEQEPRDVATLPSLPAGVRTRRSDLRSGDDQAAYLAALRLVRYAQDSQSAERAPQWHGSPRARGPTPARSIPPRLGWAKSSTDYDQALMHIRRLDRPTQARMVAQVVQELAGEVDTASLRRSHDAWARLAELREAFRRLGPVSPSPAEQLELDRQHRADMLEGKIHE